MCEPVSSSYEVHSRRSSETRAQELSEEVLESLENMMSYSKMLHDCHYYISVLLYIGID